MGSAPAACCAEHNSGPQSQSEPFGSGTAQTKPSRLLPVLFVWRQFDSCRIIFGVFWVFKLMPFTLFFKLFSIGIYQSTRPSIFRTDQQHRGKPVFKKVNFLKATAVPNSVLSVWKDFVWIVLLTVAAVFEVKILVSRGDSSSNHRIGTLWTKMWVWDGNFWNCLQENWKNVQYSINNW